MTASTKPLGCTKKILVWTAGLMKYVMVLISTDIAIKTLFYFQLIKSCNTDEYEYLRPTNLYGKRRADSVCVRHCLHVTLHVCI